MPRYQLLMWGLKATWALFIFAYGACIGSLINVIVYRMPKGISIISPPSRCPSCNTKLTWRENIPVLGWVLLGGKCRFCKSKISAEYPIVEAFVGLLFVLFYVFWYMVPDPRPIGTGAVLFGIDWAAIKPYWFMNEAGKTWPTFVVLLVLLSSLVAMTIIDARTFTIPAPLTTVPVIVAALVHTVHLGWIGMPQRFMVSPSMWSIPTPGRDAWGGIGAAAGGVLGLFIAWLLVRFGLIRRSFADYAEWEERAIAEQKGGSPGADGAASPAEAGAATEAPVMDPAAVAMVGVGAAGSPVQAAPPMEPPALPAEPSAPLDGPAAPDGAAISFPAAPDAGPADLWIQYPHARREMGKELVYLAPCVVLMAVGYFLGHRLTGMYFNQFIGQWMLPPGARVAPVWLTMLAGVALGYLIGGGVVWGVRILGSLAFGKEAMGLGDVHLMAAVGACVGWIDSVLAFFAAAFVGLAWVILSSVFSRGGGVKRTMPYGPYLAVATVLVLLGRPLIELGLSRMTGQTIRIP